MPTTFSLGTVYHFPNVGDELPLHVHPPGQHGHISVVLAGSLEYSQAGITRTVKQSDHEIIDVPFGVEHGFKALEPESVVLNIRKNTPHVLSAGAWINPKRDLTGLSEGQFTEPATDHPEI